MKVQESDGETSLESNPSKIRDIFNCPKDITVLDETKYFGSARVIAENVDNKSFDNFLHLNPRCGKSVYLHKFMILWCEEYIEFGNESEFHEGGVRYFHYLLFSFVNAAAAYNSDQLFFEPSGNATEDTVGHSCIPDFRLKLEGQPNSFLIGEIQYSRSLRAGHEKANAYLENHNVRAVIVVNIRYPWDVAHDAGRYIVENGNLLFLYYSRGGDIDPETNERIPDRIISFGDTPITAEEMEDVEEDTHFPVDRMEGVGIVPEVQCNQHTRDLPVFNHEVPSEVLLLVDPEDNMTMTNHPLNAIPQNLRFVVNLYDLKKRLYQGAREMNRKIDLGIHQVPNFTVYRL